MINKFLFVYLLSISVLASFASSATDFSCSTCPTGSYMKYTGETVNFFQPAGSYCVTPKDDYVCTSFGKAGYRSVIDSYPTPPSGCYYKEYKKNYACSVEPICDENQTLDTSVNPHVCKNNPPPACPPGQHDDLSSSEVVHCVCDSGYPTYDVMTSGIKECVQPTCPPTSPDKSLPLKMENVDYATCAKLFSPILGFDFEFLPDPNSSLTCCWSDSAKSPDGNSSEGDCGLNRTLDNNGNCVDIPRIEHDCPAETYYSYSDDTCLPIYPNSDGNQSQGGSNDGVNSNGSIREDGDDTYYNGGGSESNESEKVLLEYNDDEATNMTDAFTNTLTKKFGDFLQKTGVDILKLYTISIPTMPSCGCENITYDFNLLNAQRSGTIDICSPMSQLFSILKPVLWFFFLIGMLFNFFMGRTN